MSQKKDRDIALINGTLRLLSSKGRLWLQVKLSICFRGADHGFFICNPGCLHLQTAVQTTGVILTQKQHSNSKRHAGQIDGSCLGSLARFLLKRTQKVWGQRAGALNCWGLTLQRGHVHSKPYCSWQRTRLSS